MLLIGTSGWQYAHWRQRFYPRGLPTVRWLEHYTERFATVEVNATFYRLPKPEVPRAWAQRTPADFSLAVKLSRYATHIKQLRDLEEPVRRFLDVVEGLGSKLGPILVQLPPTLELDTARLDRALELIPPRHRVAVEFRHPSWYVPATRAVLERRGAALCLADRLGRPLQPDWRTAPWTYVRFHEGRAHPWPRYGRDALARWLDRICEEWSDAEDVFVYFNNDPGGWALRNAVELAGLAERAGRRCSRTPAPDEIDADQG